MVEFRKSLGLTENDFVVASVGELNKNKNTLRLIDAMKNVKNPNVKYLICGDGVLREQYQAKIKENNGHCACVVNFNADNICICKEFREQMEKGIPGECHCGLYIITED